MQICHNARKTNLWVKVAIGRLVDAGPKLGPGTSLTRMPRIHLKVMTLVRLTSQSVLSHPWYISSLILNFLAIIIS